MLLELNKQTYIDANEVTLIKFVDKTEARNENGMTIIAIKGSNDFTRIPSTQEEFAGYVKAIQDARARDASQGAGVRRSAVG